MTRRNLFSMLAGGAAAASAASAAIAGPTTTMSAVIDYDGAWLDGMQRGLQGIGVSNSFDWVSFKKTARLCGATQFSGFFNFRSGLVEVRMATRIGCFRSSGSTLEEALNSVKSVMAFSAALRAIAKEHGWSEDLASLRREVFRAQRTASPAR